MKYLKLSIVFAFTLIGIVAIAESFVPNQEPVYGGWYAENASSIGSYDKVDCINRLDNSSLYDIINDEDDLAGPASPIKRYNDIYYGRVESEFNELPTVKHPIVSKPIVVYRNPTITNSCGITLSSCSPRVVSNSCNRVVSNSCNRVVSNSCNTSYRTCGTTYCNSGTRHYPSNQYHYGPCGYSWRHWNYQPYQPVRNAIRFLHNRRPLRRAWASR